MSIGMLFEFNGMDSAQYDRISEDLGLYDNPPKGLTFHAAGRAESGVWRVFDIWESRALFDQFLEQRLLPTFKRLGMSGQPARQEFFPIHNGYAPQPGLINSLTNASVGASRR